MGEPTTIPAARILPGDRLWVVPNRAPGWAGPLITEVIRNLDQITIHTVNGGERTFDATDRVAVIRGD
jgi:hypothetical protein